MWNSLKKYTGLLLVLITGLIGLATYTNYGCGMDEEKQHLIGMTSYRYVFENDPGLFEFEDRDYGVALELPLIILEKGLGLNSRRAVYLMRHLINHILFLVGAFFCFLLVDFLYKDKLLAAMAFLIVVLHPRLYAHSFFNTKDIPFLSMFFVCFYLNAVAFDKKKWFWFALLGAATGLLINLRIMGLLLVACILFFLVIDLFSEKDAPAAIRRNLGLLLAFIVSTSLVLYALGPYLWPAPFSHFAQAFTSMARFRWVGDVLFKGRLTDAANLPWDYALTWFVISTPLVFLGLGACGLVLLGLKVARQREKYLSNTPSRNNLVFALCFMAPLFVVLAFKSVLYDGWRQLYFIYAGFSLLAVYALNTLMKTRFKPAVAACFLVACLPLAWFMVEAAPFAHVYFNLLVDGKTPEYIRQQYELDYWGVACKQELEHIMNNDASPEIVVAGANSDLMSALACNRALLPEHQAGRIRLTEDISYAKYFITNYRYHPEDYPFEHLRWYTVRVGNNTICAVYKLER